jgi:hypothetical protein
MSGIKIPSGHSADICCGVRSKGMVGERDRVVVQDVNAFHTIVSDPNTRGSLPQQG